MIHSDSSSLPLSLPLVLAFFLFLFFFLFFLLLLLPLPLPPFGPDVFEPALGSSEEDPGTLPVRATFERGLVERGTGPGIVTERTRSWKFYGWKNKMLMLLVFIIEVLPLMSEIPNLIKNMSANETRNETPKRNAYHQSQELDRVYYLMSL